LFCFIEPQDYRFISLLNEESDAIKDDYFDLKRVKHSDTLTTGDGPGYGDILVPILKRPQWYTHKFGISLAIQKQKTIYKI
jgi:hypothetical protein